MNTLVYSYGVLSLPRESLAILDYVFRELEATYLKKETIQESETESEPVVLRPPEKIAGKYATGSGH